MSAMTPSATQVPGGCWVVIHNPAARTARPGRLNAVLKALAAAGLESHALPTTHPGHATELARTLRDSRSYGGRKVAGVAVFGGDGTLRETAGGLLGGDLPLAFLPGGTANVMALELGIPGDPVRAATALPLGRVFPVRPGLIDGRVFLLMAGFGFDALAVQRVRPGLKRLAGKGSYFWSGLGALFQPMPRMTMIPDAAPDPVPDSGACMEPGMGSGSEPPMEGVWGIVARSGYYGGNFRVHPDAGLLHPRLGLVMVRQRGVLPYIAGQLGLNQGRRLPWVTFGQGTSVRVESEAPLAVQVDGDVHPGGRSFRLGLAGETLPMVFGTDFHGA